MQIVGPEAVLANVLVVSQVFLPPTYAKLLATLYLIYCASFISGDSKKNKNPV